MHYWLASHLASPQMRLQVLDRPNSTDVQNIKPTRLTEVRQRHNYRWWSIISGIETTYATSETSLTRTSTSGKCRTTQATRHHMVACRASPACCITIGFVPCLQFCLFTPRQDTLALLRWPDCDSKIRLELHRLQTHKLDTEATLTCCELP